MDSIAEYLIKIEDFPKLLNTLLKEKFVDKLSKKKFSIQLNMNHPLMILLNDISIEYGEDYCNNLLNLLGEYSWDQLVLNYYW